jgi:hypothetical protein
MWRWFDAERVSEGKDVANGERVEEIRNQLDEVDKGTPFMWWTKRTFC